MSGHEWVSVCKHCGKHKPVEDLPHNDPLNWGVMNKVDELAVQRERNRCIQIVRDTIADEKLLKTLTPAGALLVVAERIADPSITVITAATDVE